MTDDKKVVPIGKNFKKSNKKIEKEIKQELEDALQKAMDEPPNDPEGEYGDICNDCMDKICNDCRDKDDEFPEWAIQSPVKEQEASPMVILTSGNFRYIGAFLSADTDAVALLGYPLLITEVANSPTPNAHSEITLCFNKLFYSMGLFDQIMVRYDVLIFLDNNRSKDKWLVSLYGGAVEKFMLESVGLVPATPGDLWKLNNKNPIRS